MLGILRKMLRGGGRAGIGTVAAATIQNGEGLEILRADPRRWGLLQAVRDGLGTMGKADKDALVVPVLSRLALWIYDLPASQANHHSGRFGLLEHTLEVAGRTVRCLSEPAFRISPDPVEEHRERTGWAYAAFLGAVAHDLGKAFDIEVLLPGGEERWEPESEPLQAFLRRHGHLDAGPSLWRFRPGRGLDGHEEKMGILLPRLLAPRSMEAAGPRLDQVLQAWQTVKQGGPPDGIPVALRIARILRESDILSAREGFPPKESRPLAPQEDARKENPPSEESPVPAKVPCKPKPAPPPGELHIALPDVPPHGDPTEQQRRLEVELDPARFLDTLRRAILRRLLGRNGTYMHVFIRPDFVWFMIPKALDRIATLIRLRPTRRTLSRMIEAFRESPLAAPGEDGRVLLPVRVLPDPLVRIAVRLRTRGFLAETELLKLGLWPGVIEVCPDTRPTDPALWTKESELVPL